MTIIITRDRIALIREALASDPDPLITMDATDVAALCDTVDQWLRIRGTLDQMRPGQIVQRVTTYRVLPTTWEEGSKHAGLHKLDQLPDCDEWQLVRGRWRVRWRPPFDMLGVHLDGFWIAEEQDRRDADGDYEWRPFDTWAEAITWADQKARQA